MYKLVLVRHGQSTWNLENRFTGWTDVDLTDLGREEAHEAVGELHVVWSILLEIELDELGGQAVARGLSKLEAGTSHPLPGIGRHRVEADVERLAIGWRFQPALDELGYLAAAEVSLGE